MGLLNILKAPDPRLNTPCEDVMIGQSHTTQLADDLVNTMYAHGGQGLAAPQVGELLRMFCMRYGDRAIVMCNPLITRHGKEVVRGDEGCLSIPGQRVMVDRYKIIEIQWHSPKGKAYHAKLRGFDARCAQHEMDHLDGVLIL